MKYSKLVVGFVYYLVRFQVTNSFDAMNLPNAETLSQAASYVADKYFARTSSTFVLLHNEWNTSNRLITEKTVENILKYLDSSISVQVQQTFWVHRQTHLWGYYIIVVDSYQAFNEMFNTFPKHVYEYDLKLLIVLTTSTLYYKTFKSIFATCLFHRITEVYAIVNPRADGKILFYTYSAFSPTRCRHFEPVQADHFENGKLTKDRLYYRNQLNLHRCPLRVAIRINPPFTIYNSEIGDKSLSGLEGEIIKLIATALNFTLQVLPVLDEDTMFSPNGTPFGVLKQLVNDDADVGMGGLSRSYQLDRNFARTQPFHQSAFVIAIKEGISFGPLEQLTYPFSNTVWAILIAIHVGGLLLIRLLWNHAYFWNWKRNNPALQMIAVSLGYPTTSSPRRAKERIVLTTWLLSTFVIRNAYQGAIFDCIRINRKTPLPETLADLLRSQYKVLLFYDGSVDSMVEFKNQTINVGGTGTLKDRFQNVSSSEQRLGALVVYDNFVYYKVRHSREFKNLILLKEQLFSKQMSIFLQNYSILKTFFDYQLSKLSAFGFIGHFRKQLMSQQFAVDDTAYEPPMITYERLAGVYEIYVAMNVFSVFVFILELMSEKYVVFNRIVQWIN